MGQVPETFQLIQYVCLRDTGPQGSLWGLHDGEGFREGPLYVMALAVVKANHDH